MSHEKFAKSLIKAELGVTNAACIKAGEIILELEKQRDELLDALKMVQEAAVDMRGEDFNLTIEQWSIFHAAIDNAEK